MNLDQLSQSIQSIFDELRDSGLDINASVYRKLMAVYTDARMMHNVVDQACEDSVRLFKKNQQLEETVIRLNHIIKNLTQNNKE